MQGVGALEQTHGGRLLLVLALTVLWWACAVGVTVVLKAALEGSPGHGQRRIWDFQYPLTLTLFANIGTAAATGVVALALRKGSVGPTVPPDILRVASRELLVQGVIALSADSDQESGDAEGAPTAATADAAVGAGDSSPRERPAAGPFFGCCGSRRRRRHPNTLAEHSTPLSGSQVAAELQVLDDDRRTEPTVTPLAAMCQRLRAAQQSAYFNIVLIGLLQGLALAVKNEALLLLSVSTRTMIMATNVLIVMFVARVFRVEVLKKEKVFAAVLLAAGGMLQGVSSWQSWRASPRGSAGSRGAARPDDPIGCALALLSLLLDALRWVLLQAVFSSQDPRRTDGLSSEPGSPTMSPVGRRTAGSPASFGGSPRARRGPGHGHALSKFGMVSVVMWITTPVNLGLSMAFEPAGLREAAHNPLPLAGLVGLMTLGVTGINIAEFGVVQWTSAVTFNVLSQLHSIPMVLAGVLCFGDDVNLWQGSGFVVCLLGAVLYSYVRAREEGELPEVPKEQTERREPVSTADTLTNGDVQGVPL